MLPYYFFIVPIAAMAALSSSRRPDPVPWALAFLAIVVFVGLRHHVGMDWNNYLIMIRRANDGDFWNAFNTAEPGYAILLWISGQSGWGVYGAYFIGTVIFAAGVLKYSKTTPAPWMALLVAIPFPTIIVAMAAARQAVAMGILFWLVAVWEKSSLLKRITIVLLASMFHSSAIVFTLFIFLDMKSHPTVKLLGAVVGGAGAFYFLQISGRADYYDNVYVSGQTSATQSSGAIYHVILNGGPALMAFIIGGQGRRLLIPNELHRNMAIAAVALIPLSFVVSAASGRLTLYLFPVSMWVFAALADIFVRSDRIIVRSFQSVFFIGLLAFWLNFGNSAIAHKEYQNALLVRPHNLVFCCR